MKTIETHTSLSPSKGMRITTSTEMRELDRIADREYGISAEILMENAGRAATSEIFKEYPNAGKDSEILVFAGKGNNAGDAFVVARRLLCLSRRVRVFHLVHPERYQGATLKNFEILKKMKAKMMQLESVQDLEQFFDKSNASFVAIDGILGTGLKGDLEGIFYDVVELLNKRVDTIIALDIPTGVNGDTGRIQGTSIFAAMTISFGFPKMGHFLPPGASRRGKLVNVDISLPPKFRGEGDTFLFMKAQMSALLKDRDKYGHKNSFGHTLLVGGSPGRLGAINMAAQACHKMGTGLVTVATWEDCIKPLMGRLADETMAVPIALEGPQADQYRRFLPSYSSVVVGPGLGTRPEGKSVMTELLTSYPGPLVIDADALNLIAEYRLHDLIVKRQAPTILTPHPGEMSRLLGVDKKEITENPLASIKQAVELTHATVLLKGAATLINSPDGQIFLNHYPNDGMATAGSGDVLAGMIGGLVGQKMNAFEATQLGVYLHSLAGELAANQFGHRSMTAPDIINGISHAFQAIKKTEGPAFPEEGRATLL
jgi:ADP-dependent NAD(P)H-hydrate dehydratase / NAD(P)H-hydrate epimerase